MIVFISYLNANKTFAAKLADTLRKNGFEVLINELSIPSGDNIIEKVKEGLVTADAFIAVLSNAYLSSTWGMHELSFVSARAMSDPNLRVIPVVLEDCDIPVFIRDHNYADFRGDFTTAAEAVVRALGADELPDLTREEQVAQKKQSKRSSLSLHANKLMEHLRRGEMTIVCGAGISTAAGVPTWPVLLNELLSDLIHKSLPYCPVDLDDRKKIAALYQDHFSPSALVVAQYLKNGLGTAFLKMVRRSLYSKSPRTSDLLEAIIELCRPQRSRADLASIITFNFDDLIEYNLDNEQIKYRSIFSEGQRADRSELAIFHPHGFLPRVGDIDDTHSIVFSEDDYHSQFMDPFSWSNLVQLNHLANNVCLFVGLSMSDPNLRRLLDVAMRKNPDRKVNHYVFKRRHANAASIGRISELALIGDDAKTAQRLLAMSEMLEEQDHTYLGLNTIWIDSYDEIPDFLRILAKEA